MRIRGTAWLGVLLAVGPAGAEVLRPQAGAQWAEVRLEGDRLEARPLQPCEHFSLTVQGPGRLWSRQAFSCGTAGSADLSEAGVPAAEGAYTWEVKLLGQAEVARVAWGRFSLGQADQEPSGDYTTGARVPNADLTIADPTPRLFFDDTDAGAIDWQVGTNTDGAQFVLQNTALGTTPVTVSSGAPTNSLVVGNSGSSQALGIGEAAPLFDAVHISGSGIFSRVVLEPNDPMSPWLLQAFGGLTPGFALQTNGRQVVRILGVPPARSLQLDSTGDVAMFADNTQGPDIAGASLHVKRTNGTAKLKVEEASTTTQSRNMLQIVNNGASTFRFDNSLDGSIWGFGSRGTGDFFIGKTPGQTFAFNLTSAGNLTITGTLTQGSDRNTKEGIDAVDPASVLARVADLPIATWRYKGDTATHAGPMAQDFHQAFGLGEDDKHIAPGDMAGLGLAAIQALVRQNEDLRAELDRLRARVTSLEGGR